MEADKNWSKRGNNVTIGRGFCSWEDNLMLFKDKGKNKRESRGGNVTAILRDAKVMRRNILRVE
jgi:hypothetical protein